MKIKSIVNVTVVSLGLAVLIIHFAAIIQSLIISDPLNWSVFFRNVVNFSDFYTLKFLLILGVCTIGVSSMNFRNKRE